jgi:hypothetical protein
MISDIDRYHGVVFRQLVTGAESPLTIGKCDKYGQINTYALDQKVAIHIKYSSKRLAPWTFSFTVDHLRELAEIQSEFRSVWLVLVCGLDGIVAITLAEFVSITGSRPGGVASLRIDRSRNSMYRVYGNERLLPSARSKGVAGIVQELG